MMSYPPTAERVNREVLSYLNENDSLNTLLQLYTEIYAVQRNFSQELAEATTFRVLPDNNLEQGIPMLENNPLIFSAESLKLLATNMFNKAGHHPEEITKAVLETFTEKNVRDFYSNPDNLSVEAIESFLPAWTTSGNEANSQLELVALLIRMAVKVYYVTYAKKVKETYDLDGWNKGICPVCGQQPMLGMLRHGDGARVLECGLCHTQWTFSRLVCPSCNNVDQDTLGFFYQKNRQNRRVYICNQCKFYLKTTILKNTERDIIPELEDAATLYLDILAHEEGYRFSGVKVGSH